MKRTALLLAILAVFSITSVSQVCALPVAGEKAVSASSWLSYYFAIFLRAHGSTIDQTGLIIGDNNDVILRGDADDYANGKDGDDEIDPTDLSDIKRSSGLTSSGFPLGTGGIAPSKY